MKAKKSLSELPNSSFLVDKKYFHFYDFFHSVCLLTFAYYNANDTLCYIYHLLIDDCLVRVFTDYFIAVDYVSKLV